MPGNTPYCLSKGGMRMLTRTAGVELGPHGVIVVGVGPGAVDTPINTATMADPEKMKTLDAAIPLGRMAEPRRSAASSRSSPATAPATSPRRRSSPTAASCTPAPGSEARSTRSPSDRSVGDSSLVGGEHVLGRGRRPGAVGAGADGVHAGVHIILVPLGVSWAFMALIANYRGIKHDDADALRLAQRWSKYMAVTFAVGAVTGTVLTFEFGLLWPQFMGQWGEAFGVPFAFEGLFFFTEAIFVAIYIYGWRRLKPWPHFWTGVPVVITGILGSVVGRRRQRLDERARRVHPRLGGQGRRRRPVGGDLQRRDAV